MGAVRNGLVPGNWISEIARYVALKLFTLTSEDGTVKEPFVLGVQFLLVSPSNFPSVAENHTNVLATCTSNNMTS